MGAYREGKNRPIIANFASWKARDSVLQNARKFKGTAFSVSENFSRTVQEKRRLLWNYTKEKRDRKEIRVQLKYDKAVINGDTYIWDSDTRQPALLRARAHSNGE